MKVEVFFSDCFYNKKKPTDYGCNLFNAILEPVLAAPLYIELYQLWQNFSMIIQRVCTKGIS